MERNSKKSTDISKYIVCIEGIDGCGKDTQLKMLSDDGFFVSGEPNYDSPIGKLIKSILTKEYKPESVSTIEYLWAADRTEHLARMSNHVNNADNIKGKMCITGRYKYSGLAYSNDPKVTYYINSQLPEAGLFILLDINPNKALKRIASRDGNKRDIYENIEKLTIVNDKFTKMVYDFKKSEPGLFPEVVIIDAELSIEEIHEQIKIAIDNYCTKLESNE